MREKRARSGSPKPLLAVLAGMALLAPGCNSPEEEQQAAATPEVTPWAKSFGGANTDYATCADITKDAGFIVAFDSDSYDSSGYAAVLMKLDSNGRTLWTRRYPGIVETWTHTILQTSDGGFVAVGGYQRDESSNDVWIMKVTASGEVEWDRTIGGPNYDAAQGILETEDGGFLVSATTRSFGAGGYDLWLLKFAGDGALEWQITYGGPGHDWAYCAKAAPDGDFVVAGGTTSFGKGQRDGWVLKVSKTGVVKWQRSIGGIGSEWFTTIAGAADDGFLLGGVTYSFGAGFTDFWIVRVDGSGGVLWQKAMGGIGDDQARSIQLAAGGGWIVGGMTNSFGAGSEDCWLIKLDRFGTVEWQKTYGSPGSEGYYWVEARVTPDQGFFVAASSQSMDATTPDTWAFRLDRNGNIGFNKGCGFSVNFSAAVPDETLPSVGVSDALMGIPPAQYLNPGTSSVETDAASEDQAP